MQPTKTTSVFELKNTINGIRRGIITTRAGNVDTPVFMPVGTRAALKGLTNEQIEATGVQIILNNTYHLHLKPGEDVIKSLGGLHEFTLWNKPILTDSGGFQVFSLGHVNKITDDGVTFNDPTTGDEVFLSPEKAMQIQIDLGADIIMAFDDVVGLDEKSRGREEEAFKRTHMWLERCIKEFKRLTKDMLPPGHLQVHGSAVQGADEQRKESYSGYEDRVAQSATQNSAPSSSRVRGSASDQTGAVNLRERPLLFGIAQGGLDKSLRKRSLEIVQSSDVDGVAIGGLSVGEPRKEMHEMLDFLAPLYDPSKAHYLMGIGEPIDMRYAIEHGIDMFDCVLPTRNGRHGTVWQKGCVCDSSSSKARPELATEASYDISSLRGSLTVPNVRLTGTSQKKFKISSQHSPSDTLKCSHCGSPYDLKIHLTNAKYAKDKRVIDENCDCYTCASGYSKGYLRHLFKVGESLAGSLASIHNIRYLNRICEDYRKGD